MTESGVLTCKLPSDGVSIHRHPCPTCKSGFTVMVDGWGLPTEVQVQAEYAKHRLDCESEHSKVRFRKVY